MGRPFEIPEPIDLKEQSGATFPEVVKLMRRLLAKDGCPWDREQDLTSLRQYLLEESCEVMDTLESGNRQGLREELGDLAFQIVFLCELAQREGSFGPDDVFREVIEKLVRRHPHVFSNTEANTSEQVETNWEAIKAEEKRDRPLLDNIPRSLPALLGAARMSERVARVGFDWSDAEGSRLKVDEEMAELTEAIELGQLDAMEHELGDLIFALVNYGRHLGVDAEKALQRANRRFRGRFEHVEGRVREVHGDWPRDGHNATRGISLLELSEFWDEAKERERGS
jgi:tetrapyrrole methylase family protein/MazG family protein/ATP diphosphatase